MDCVFLRSRIEETDPRFRDRALRRDLSDARRWFGTAAGHPPGCVRRQSHVVSGREATRVLRGESRRGPEDHQPASIAWDHTAGQHRSGDTRAAGSDERRRRKMVAALDRRNASRVRQRWTGRRHGGCVGRCGSARRIAEPQLVTRRATDGLSSGRRESLASSSGVGHPACRRSGSYAPVSFPRILRLEIGWCRTIGRRGACTTASS